ncbi:hypothetical protein AA313_de0204001 [Arthrobotrys entomopaga]|nr:hypothetical protein AA313_de0204001 [Arthrobotrys entomopaga]
MKTSSLSQEPGCSVWDTHSQPELLDFLETVVNDVPESSSNNNPQTGEIEKIPLNVEKVDIVRATNRLARPSDFDHRSYLAYWRDQTIKFMQVMLVVADNYGVYLMDAARMMGSHIEDGNVYTEPLPYYVYLELTRGEIAVAGIEESTGNLEPLDDLVSTMLKEIENHYISAGSGGIGSQLITYSFKRMLEYLPQLKKDWGQSWSREVDQSHFFDYYSFYVSASLMDNFKVFPYCTMKLLWIVARYVAEGFSISYHSLMLDCIYGVSWHNSDDPADRGILTRHQIRENILKLHTNYHHRLLFVYSELAFQMIHSPDFHDRGVELTGQAWSWVRDQPSPRNDLIPN